MQHCSPQQARCFCLLSSWRRKGKKLTLQYKRVVIWLLHCILNKCLFLFSVMDIRQRYWGGRWRRGRRGSREWELKKGPYPQKQWKEKLFTHPSFLIAPLKHSTNETYCWFKKKINKKKKNCARKLKVMLFTIQIWSTSEKKNSIPLVCVCSCLPICAVSAVEKWLIDWYVYQIPSSS